MLHNLIILFRQIKRDAFFSILKIGGLTIGFSVFIVLLSMVRKELSYDEFWPNKNKLCRVALEKYYQGELQVRSARNYRAMSDLMMQEFPEVEGRLRIGQDVITLFAEETQIQDVAMFWSDTSLFSVLGLSILDSEGSWPFADVHATVISESLALALYGTSDAVGRELEVNEGWKFYVSAVFEDIPDNSHLKADMFTEWRSLFYYLNNFDNNTGELVDDPEWTYTAPTPSMAWAWNDHYVYNYILVREDADIAGLQADTEKLLETFNLPERFEDSRIYPIIQPVTDIHLNSAYPDEIRANSSMYRIYMLLLIGSIVLIISWINFINLFAIGFHEKTADMAVHLINGASKLNIQKLTLQKGLLLSLASGILAALIICLVVKAFDPGMLFDLYTILILLALVLLTALLTMIIPMTSISTAKLMDYLRGKVFGKMKGTTYRRALVLLQFASSVVLISCTVVIYLQMEFMRRKDLGFNPEDIIYTFSPMTMNLRPDIPQKLIQFENAMARYPGVKNFSVSSSIPGKPIGFPGFIVYRSVGQDERESFVNRINIHPGYFEVYEIEFLAGENYRNDHNYESSELVINRTASELMGFDQPGEAIGEFLRIGQNQFSIIGVDEDYHHLSLKSEIMPLVFFKHLWWRMGVGFYSFKLSGDEPAILPQIGETWSHTYPGENFISSYLGNSYLEQYKADRAFGRSFMIAAVLAILVSCLGLLGLTKYNALKRTREIGIRKTFGASSSNILYLLQSESLILIMISIVLGIPLALSIVNRWLKNFAYHIDPAWWMFLLAILVTFLVALLSISFLSIRTSRANPVDSLRYE